MIVDIKSQRALERTDTLKRFYADVRACKSMTEEEESAIFREYRSLKEQVEDAKKQNDYAEARMLEERARKLRDAIAQANLRFVISIARTYTSGFGDELSDLIEEGNIGLINAIESFSPDNGSKFTTYAVHYIRREINTYKIDKGELVRKNNISKTYHAMSKVTNKFIQENHREPTSDELMERFNEMYPGAKIKDSCDMLKVRVKSIDEMTDDDDDGKDINGLAEYNSISAMNNGYEYISEREHASKLMATMLGKLKQQESSILKMYFGIGTPFNNAYDPHKIADIVGLTPARVRQIITESKEKLRREFSKTRNYR